MSTSPITIDGAVIGYVSVTIGDEDTASPSMFRDHDTPAHGLRGRGTFDDAHHAARHGLGTHGVTAEHGFAAPRHGLAAHGTPSSKPPLWGMTPSSVPPPLEPGYVSRPSKDVDAAIREAATKYGLNPDDMRGIASIESGMNPKSGPNRGGYTGLFQMGRNEWAENGQGDIYNARDNAMAAARLLSTRKADFHVQRGRDPTGAELYMLHQQGPGFYTSGSMTNIAGNPYPGMRGPQTQQSFQEGWGRELERRKRLLGPTETPSSGGIGSK